MNQKYPAQSPMDIVRQSLESEQVPEIPDLLGQQNREITELNHIIDRLYENLAPVMRPVLMSGPAGPGCTSNPLPAYSQIGHAIDNHSLSIREARRRLNELLDSLAV